MHMLFPFSKMLSKFFVVSFPLSWFRSYSIASSRTQFTYTSNPFKVPVNSLCPFFMIIQTFSLTHLSTSSDGRRREGLFGAADCFVGNAILYYYRDGVFRARQKCVAFREIRHNKAARSPAGLFENLRTRDARKAIMRSSRMRRSDEDSRSRSRSREREKATPFKSAESFSSPKSSGKSSFVSEPKSREEDDDDEEQQQQQRWWWCQRKRRGRGRRKTRTRTREGRGRGQQKQEEEEGKEKESVFVKVTDEEREREREGEERRRG